MDRKLIRNIGIGVGTLILVLLLILALTTGKKPGKELVDDNGEEIEYYDGLEITDKMVKEAEKEFTEEKIIEQITETDYFSEEFKLSEYRTTEIAFDEEIGEYFTHDAIEYKGYANEVYDETLLDVEEVGKIIEETGEIPYVDFQTVRKAEIMVGKINDKPTYVNFDIYEDNTDEALQKAERAIYKMTSELIGDEITQEMFNMENGTTAEHQIKDDLLVTLSKNVDIVSEGDSIDIKYYFEILRDDNKKVDLSTYKLNDTLKETISWLPQLNNEDITKIGEDISKIYRDNAEHKVMKLKHRETEEGDYDIDTEVMIRTTLDDGESVKDYYTNIELIGIKDVNDASKINRLIYIDAELTTFDTDEEAAEASKWLVERLVGGTLEYKDGTDIGSDETIYIRGDNSPYVENARTFAQIDKYINEQGRVSAYLNIGVVSKDNYDMELMKDWIDAGIDPISLHPLD